MEFTLTTFFLLICSFLFFLIKLTKKSSSPRNLPPSPPSLPVIGHLHHLLSGLPHQSLRLVSSTFGPVLLLRLGQVPAVIISSRAAAREVLKSRDPAFADRPGSVASKIMFYDHSDIVFSPYGDYWRQMLKICILELLSAKNVKSFASIRRDEVSRLVNSLMSKGETVNLTDMISTFTSSITCRAAFGDVMRDQGTLIRLMKRTLAMGGGFGAADLFPILKGVSWSVYKLKGMRKKMDVILDELLEEHRMKKSGEFGGEDILDVLLRMQRNGELKFPITDDNIKAVIFDMFSAGTETSSATINWAMAELVRNPRVMAKAQAEIREAAKGKSSIDETDIQSLKYLKMVIKETLRLHPPLPLLPRACREECEVSGYTIPLDTKIMVNAWAIGRDPEYWPEPDRFQPERFESNSLDFLGNNFEFLPFGAGKRICPGMNFGLANVELPLAELLFRFDWGMPEGMRPEDIDMSEVEGIVVSRKEGLFLIPRVYNSAI